MCIRDRSVSLSAATAASARRTGRLYAHMRSAAIYEWSASRTGRCARALAVVVNEQKILLIVKDT